MLRQVEQDPMSIDLPAKQFYGSFSYASLPTVDVAGLSIQLLPFQKEGVGWMIRRERFHAGGIMADHLGMGKTVQMIALSLGADTVTQNLEKDVATSHFGYRLLTVLRQMQRIASVGNCSKISRPGKEIHAIATETEALIKHGASDFTDGVEETKKWLAFAGKLHPTYEKRALAFLSERECEVEYQKVDSAVLRTLVVVPAALLLQWKSEIETKVSPERKVSVLVFHGANKTIPATVVENFDFVLTTYDTLAVAASKCFSSEDEVAAFDRKSAGPLFEVFWKRIILDEAHVIRHAQTLRWQAVLQLRGVKRWAVTATPLHNSINDLQNLLFFSGSSRLPVFPGAQNQDIVDDPRLQEVIAKALQPVFLRRGPTIVRDGKKEVLVSLPPKEENVVLSSLSPSESTKYNDILSRSRTVASGSATAVHIFALMTKLRLTCCHEWLAEGASQQVFPCNLCKCEAVNCVTTKCGHTFCGDCLLLKFREAEDGDNEAVRILCPACESPVPNTVFKKKTLSSAQRTQSMRSRPFVVSTKLQMLLTTVNSMLSSSTDDKMIVFSHFTSFLDVIGLALENENIPFLRLDGSMPLSVRNSIIGKFQSSPSVRVLIASKTATGVGLNLTAANHVVIVDPWWNPAIEEQAIHRCHRIGQKKPVKVSRLVVADSIEQYCYDISKKKKDFGDAILRAATSSDSGGKVVASKLQELLARLNYVGAKR